MEKSKYLDLEEFSEATGLPCENLVRAFEMEKVFHSRILNEPCPENRKELYLKIYNTVRAIYGKSTIDVTKGKNPKDGMVKFFRKEIENKSILDVGCGEGYFLASVASQLKHKRLVGLEVSIPQLCRQHPEIEFLVQDVVDFHLDERFDVVFSDNVLEHIAPADLDVHLKSVRASLKKDGLFIVILPNRLFGPSDVTRIIDFSYTNRIPAQGTHLNEMTYSELIPILCEHGFTAFMRPLSIPKLRYLLRNVRISPVPFLKIEQNRYLMQLLYRLKFRGQCKARFRITLICRAG